MIRIVVRIDDAEMAAECVAADSAEALADFRRAAQVHARLSALPPPPEHQAVGGE